jgi:hypothetical protein
MAQNRRSEFVHGTNVTLEVYVDGTGSALVVLPSYGRDGGEDFDYFARRVGAAGFTVLRPQPQGIAGSKGNLEGVTMHDLAADIALVMRSFRNSRTGSPTWSSHGAGTCWLMGGSKETEGSSWPRHFAILDHTYKTELVLMNRRTFSLMGPAGC